MRVLVAEDDALTALALRRHLERLGHETVVAADGAEAWARFQQEGAFDAVISDWRMPGLEGPELCRRVRSREAAGGYTYFILLTGLGDRRHAAEGLAAGADDYLAKPPDAEELRLRLIVAARVAALHRRLAEQAVELHRLAETDALTGLANRRAATEQLRWLVRLAGREARPMAVAVLDLDHFKRVNDEHGHAAGDAVLAGVAGHLRRALREHDVVARWGGEEFLLGLYGADHGAGMRRLEALLGELRRDAFGTPGAGPLRVTCSAGVAAFPVDGTDLDELIDAADAALYRAKAAGRDRAASAGEEDA